MIWLLRMRLNKEAAGGFRRLFDGFLKVSVENFVYFVYNIISYYRFLLESKAEGEM